MQIFFKILGCFVCFIVSIQVAYSQTDGAFSKISLSNSASLKFIKTDSGLILKRKLINNCKSFFYEYSFFPQFIQALPIPAAENLSVGRKPTLITLHGNIEYDYFYRSKTDNPFTQNDLQQHTEKINLDILIKEKYPLKVNFITRQSNSPYFRNFIDLNLNFDRFAYNKILKQLLLEKIKSKVPAYKYPDLASIESKIKAQVNEYNSRKNWLEDPSTLQKIVEEREKLYYKQMKEKQDSLQLAMQREINYKNPKYLSEINTNIETRKQNILNKKDTLNARIKTMEDSLAYPIAKLYETKKVELDSLLKNIEGNRKKADSLKNTTQQNVASIQQKIYSATNEKELRKIALENGIVVENKNKEAQRLSAIKTFGVGRSMVNYTELTAQNITVTGVNIEYNPSVYVAFTAGKIDYRFRDFYNKNIQRNNQFLVMGRLGFGDKDKKAIIFSLFQGRKNSSQFSLTDSIKNYVNILGYSIETIYKKDEHTSISAEFAKSTKPITGSLQGNKQSGALVAFDDPSNMGINIKAQTMIAETNTKLSGFFRKTGENFQSFSLFSYHTDQTAWLARFDQPFIKNKITLTGMLRRNDFTNPFVEKTYKTSTTFKSILLNVRFPKYPAVSIGYFPGTQLYSIDKETIRESAYYILNGTFTYSYYYKNVGMNSLLVFNKYTSQASDSGFITYKGISYYASQTIFLKKLQIQAGGSYTKQPELEYHTIESSADYVVKNWLKAGVGIKYNRISKGITYWGQRVQLSIDFKQFGNLQFQYEKSYLPTLYKSLYPVEMGKVSWYKYF